MAHTHEFDCIVCGSHFESSKDLAKHNEEAHLSTATGTERPRVRIEDEITDAERDRNPGQGFRDPRNDTSDRT